MKNILIQTSSAFHFWHPFIFLNQQILIFIFSFLSPEHTLKGHFLNWNLLLHISLNAKQKCKKTSFLYYFFKNLDKTILQFIYFFSFVLNKDFILFNLSPCFRGFKTHYAIQFKFKIDPRGKQPQRQNNTTVVIKLCPMVFFSAIVELFTSEMFLFY